MPRVAAGRNVRLKQPFGQVALEVGSGAPEDLQRLFELARLFAAGFEIAGRLTDDLRIARDAVGQLLKLAVELVERDATSLEIDGQARRLLDRGIADIGDRRAPEPGRRPLRGCGQRCRIDARNIGLRSDRIGPADGPAAARDGAANLRCERRAGHGDEAARHDPPGCIPVGIVAAPVEQVVRLAGTGAAPATAEAAGAEALTGQRLAGGAVQLADAGQGAGDLRRVHAHRQRRELAPTIGKLPDLPIERAKLCNLRLRLAGCAAREQVDFDAAQPVRGLPDLAQRGVDLRGRAGRLVLQAQDGGLDEIRHQILAPASERWPGAAWC
ncbi:hypothetical protein [Bosea sp. ANAM02]|uniref:hypothetical protein n=1 Tax=Bosea sp. ANAM02 TaxID=2020412 RepID=UPI001564D244|nr:hypothetical protein [Bosea sp. ANAM02]